jgi:hypothetical protein
MKPPVAGSPSSLAELGPLVGPCTVCANSQDAVAGQGGECRERIIVHSYTMSQQIGRRASQGRRMRRACGGSLYANIQGAGVGGRPRPVGRGSLSLSRVLYEQIVRGRGGRPREEIAASVDGYTGTLRAKALPGGVRQLEDPASLEQAPMRHHRCRRGQTDRCELGCVHQGVGAQVAIESKTRKQFTTLWFQAPQPGAINTGLPHFSFKRRNQAHSFNTGKPILVSSAETRRIHSTRVYPHFSFQRRNQAHSFNIGFNLHIPTKGPAMRMSSRPWS